MAIRDKQPGDACAFCGDVDSDLYVCDGCGQIMCCDCGRLASPSIPAEFCEECCEQGEADAD